ncbi:hypothetical protein RA11412_0704 [Rothia aeria]|uniref:Uncharacterized protein n=1 Tax=Rothia aeria TaxID=172042 RepID=A0A2Z5QXD7_9MICC|nr:hypothetical protein RA11412_0704 [Rothia aeria]
MRLPRVCMGGSSSTASNQGASESAPRVHGWFLEAKVPGGRAASAPRVHGWFRSPLPPKL